MSLNSLVEYLTEDLDPVPGAPLRSGSAGFVRPTAAGDFESESRLRLSANSTHALMGHGVVASLNQLPLQGRLGTGMQVLIPPGQLEPARLLFYRADEKTYGRNYEFEVGGQEHRDPGVEYRIRIDNREYQQTLSGLQYLLRTASHDGLAAWITI